MVNTSVRIPLGAERNEVQIKGVGISSTQKPGLMLLSNQAELYFYLLKIVPNCALRQTRVKRTV